MTKYEFFRSKTIEEIADAIVSQRLTGFDVGPDCFFNEGIDCIKRHCEYVDESSPCDIDSSRGQCNLAYGEKCPYNIDRREVAKGEVIKWLNSKISV